MSAARRWLSRESVSAPWPVAAVAGMDRRERSIKDRAWQKVINYDYEMGSFEEPASNIRAVRKRSCRIIVAKCSWDPTFSVESRSGILAYEELF